MRPIYEGKDREVMEWVQISAPVKRSPFEQYPVLFGQMEKITINSDGKEIPIMHYGFPPGAGNWIIKSAYPI